MDRKFTSSSNSTLGSDVSVRREPEGNPVRRNVVTRYCRFRKKVDGSSGNVKGEGDV